MPLTPRRLPLEYFTDAIVARRPLTLSRWGDGEWRAIFGKSGRNCDGHGYFPAMGQELAAVLTGLPPYLLGMQSLALRLFGGRIALWLGQQAPALEWIDADVFHHASEAGRLEPFMDALRESRPVVVGPEHLAALPRFLGFRAHVVVPSRNCYLNMASWRQEALEAAAALPDGGVVTVSASMPGKLLVDWLFQQTGGRLSILDVGSLFDPYAGVRSREYMRRMQPIDASLPVRGRCS